MGAFNLKTTYPISNSLDLIAFKGKGTDTTGWSNLKKMKHPTQPSQKQQAGYKKTIWNSEQHHGKEII